MSGERTRVNLKVSERMVEELKLLNSSSTSHFQKLRESLLQDMAKNILLERKDISSGLDNKIFIKNLDISLSSTEIQIGDTIELSIPEVASLRNSTDELPGGQECDEPDEHDLLDRVPIFGGDIFETTDSVLLWVCGPEDAETLVYELIDEVEEVLSRHSYRRAAAHYFWALAGIFLQKLKSRLVRFLAGDLIDVIHKLVSR